jgi:hypothetical protein
MRARVKIGEILVGKANQNPAAWAQHPGAFRYEGLRFIQVIDRLIEDHNVKRRVFERHIVGIEPDQRDPLPVMTAGFRKQRHGEISGDHRSCAPGKQAQSHAGPAGNFKDILAPAVFPREAVARPHSLQLGLRSAGIRHFGQLTVIKAHFNLSRSIL